MAVFLRGLVGKLHPLVKCREQCQKEQHPAARRLLMAQQGAAPGR